MTLDLAKFISNSIKTQAKIQHLDISTKTTAADSIPTSVTSLITKQYGQKYLQDADFVSFFWGAIKKEQIEKLFNVVDKALGKSANKLTETDFKKISFDSNASAPAEELEDDSKEDDEESEETEEVEVEVDEEPDDDDDDDEDDDSEEADDEEELNEDDNEAEAPAPVSRFFLKITLK